MKTRKLGEQEYREIYKFIKRHGPNIFKGTDERMFELLDYFAGIKRLFITRDTKGRIIGLACVNNISDPWPLIDNEWPTDDPDGEILYVWAIAIHKNARHMGVMGQMLKEWLRVFPQIKFIMFKRTERENMYKMMPIERILRRTR